MVRGRTLLLLGGLALAAFFFLRPRNGLIIPPEADVVGFLPTSVQPVPTIPLPDVEVGKVLYVTMGYNPARGTWLVSPFGAHSKEAPVKGTPGVYMLAQDWAWTHGHDSIHITWPSGQTELMVVQR